LPFQPKRARPYLYSDEEIKSLLRAALAMPCRYERGALRPWVYYSLFGLLSVSGLRLGEARNLELHDIDLRAAVLTMMQQRQASPHTISSYRDTFRQFLKFTEQRLHKAPSLLNFEEIDAPLIMTFLDHLEKHQGVSTRSRAHSRHTTAMALLQGGVDTSSIALWLGHESPATTHIYLDANLALKEKILGKMETWNGTKTGRYRPEDPVLKFLKSL